MSAFTEKNEARKGAMQAQGARAARLRRRIYKGKFGLSPVHIYNELAVGTTSVTRMTSKATS
jgi:hypothetical protein